MAQIGAIADFLQAAQEKKRLQLLGLSGLGPSFATALLSQTRPVLFIAKDRESAENIYQNLLFLMQESKAQSVFLLPAEERTPYHSTSPDRAIMLERCAILHKLATGAPFSALVLCADDLGKKIAPLRLWQEMAEMLEQGQLADREELISKLDLGGYTRVNSVEDSGTFAVRGSIIDIFWPGSPLPIRLDFFSDEIESIKFFNPQNQRAIETVPSCSFGPVKDIILSPEHIKHAIKQLRELADEVEYPTKKLKEKISQLENKIPFFGIESFLPGFYAQLQTPLELINQSYGRSALTIVSDYDLNEIKGPLEKNAQEYDSHYGSALAKGELCFSPTHFLATGDEVLAQLSEHTFISLSPITRQESVQTIIQLPINSTSSLRQDILIHSATLDNSHEKAHSLLEPLAKKINELKKAGYLIFLPMPNFSGCQRIKELLAALNLQVNTLKDAPNLLLGDDFAALRKHGVHAFTYHAKPRAPGCGAIFDELKVALFAEDDIFGKRSRRDGKAGAKGRFRTTLADINEGDAVVHVDNGVGIFRGLTKLNVRGIEQDYLLITYAGDDKLYLPVHRINLIQAYSGVEGKQPHLDKLGGSGWQTKKKKVKDAVMAMAQDLLNLYAKRELATRPIFSHPNADYWEFEAEFAFETTADQQKAIDDVIADMQRSRPMDRLICGDVGYGKTEVAMRAAMLACISGAQVAVLAPTTILAQQHALTFAERFKETGVNIGVVSRFQKPLEVRKALADLKDGKLDILIGTHRILSPDVSFQNLGLVIVDEEQRFGIKAKEQLKKMRTHADMLTLTATPIPRTLQMGYFGIRDLSVIETPPVDRRAIRTSIVRFDDEIIREGILRELSRGGQTYFVHNRVRSIHAKADHLRKLIPEASIEVAHGQMDADELEDIMVRFMKHEIQVLVCTSIIETGIDVPSANTMFVDHADDFGLAQLYQLRGRIGRSKERAFAYLVIPGDTEQLTPVARKRLEILHQFSELGAGFRIAQHDLELRGAGDLLGSSQHGHVATVGYDLYSELLKEAVEALKGQPHDSAPDPDVNLPICARIPDNYISDMHERLGVYQQLATAHTNEQIWEIIGSMNEQFGEAPDDVTALAEIMILKQSLKRFSALSIDSGMHEGRPKIIISLGAQAKINPEKLSDLIKKNAEQMSLTPKMQLIFLPTKNEWEVKAGSNIITLCKYLSDLIFAQV